MWFWHSGRGLDCGLRPSTDEYASSVNADRRTVSPPSRHTKLVSIAEHARNDALFWFSPRELAGTGGERPGEYLQPEGCLTTWPAVPVRRPVARRAGQGTHAARHPRERFLSLRARCAMVTRGLKWRSYFLLPMRACLLVLIPARRSRTLFQRHARQRAFDGPGGGVQLPQRFPAAIVASGDGRQCADPMSNSTI
jgi:hypothetical protein